MAQQVKDWVLSLLWLESQLWREFNPWPGNFRVLQVWPKKKGFSPNSQPKDWAQTDTFLSLSCVNATQVASGSCCEDRSWLVSLCQSYFSHQ